MFPIDYYNLQVLDKNEVVVADLRLDTQSVDNILIVRVDTTAFPSIEDLAHFREALEKALPQQQIVILDKSVELCKLVPVPLPSNIDQERLYRHEAKAQT